MAKDLNICERAVEQRMTDAEMQAMLIEYMGKGFLENIIALFRQDPALMRFIPAMIADEQVAVRLGATALVEDLAAGHREQLRASVPGLIALLSHENPTIRGDAANLLGLIRDPAASGPLRKLRQDPNDAVRQMAEEALHDIG